MMGKMKRGTGDPATHAPPPLRSDYGYRLTVACPCGVVFERWVTSVDAELDLLHAASLN